MTYLLLLTVILAPAYVLKFSLAGLPTDVLMLWVFIFWLIFLYWLIAKKQLSVFLTAVKNTDKKVLWFGGLFFLAGFISSFVGGLSRANLGQFIVLFFQPTVTFFVARFIFSNVPKSKTWLFNLLYVLLAIAGVYALFQYFTLVGLPPAWWGNSVEPKRALSFFVHPNFYALWCAPLLALLLPDLGFRIKDLGKNWLYIVGWIVGAAGLLFSLSRSGWLGLSAAVLVYLIVAADKKIRKIILGAAVIIAIFVAIIPNLRWRVILPFYGEKSADSRIELWSDGLKGIKESPILGLGLTGFANKYISINTDPTLDPHNYPHNIFLDVWVETGILGLISFLGLVYIYLTNGFKNRQNLFALSVSLFLIAILFQGLVDNPYFKNDLALIFWMVLALAI